jgi:hypothetical protein
MTTTITSACEHAGVFYKVGDVVENHEVAAMLTEFGYAKSTGKTAPADPAAAAATTAGNGKKES